MWCFHALSGHSRFLPWSKTPGIGSLHPSPRAVSPSLAISMQSNWVEILQWVTMQNLHTLWSNSKMTTHGNNQRLLRTFGSGEDGAGCLQSWSLPQWGQLGLFMPDWPAQPDWLTCNQYWLNAIPQQVYDQAGDRHKDEVPGFATVLTLPTGWE